MDGLLDFIKKYRRIIIAFLSAFSAAAVGAYFISPYLIGLICALLKHHQLFQTEVAEGFIIRFKVAVLLAAVVTVFAVLLFLLLKSGRNKKLVLIAVFSALVLFVSGVLFSYFVLLPSAINMLCRLLPYKMHIGVSSFVVFCSVMMLVIGLMFEEPLVIYSLYRAGIVKPAFLKSKRHGVYLAVLILMAAITPSQDAVTLIISMIPFVVLYEGALLWIGLLERKKTNE